MSPSPYQRGLEFFRAGQLASAESYFKQQLALEPKHGNALHMLAIVCYQSNRSAAALAHMQQALALEPRNLDYLNNYALMLRAANQPAAALHILQQALAAQPKDLDIQLNLGNTLLELNRFAEAAVYFRRLLHASPSKDGVAPALCHCLSSLGNQAQAQGHFSQAEACFVEALTLNSTDAALYYNLGNAQRELGKPQAAAKQYQQAIALAPDDADSFNNLGNVQRELGQLDLAIASYQRALALNPQLYHAQVHLVHQKQHICDWHGLAADIQQIRDWVQTTPSAQVSPFAFLAMPGTSAAEQKRCADNWVNNRYAALQAQGKQLNYAAATAPISTTTSAAATAHKKIRIGYLSADFRLHPLAFLVSELIELHDRAQFEIIGFSYGIDDKTAARQRLVEAFDQFHDIRSLSETEAAAKIHSCAIDILLDLTGFTQTSRSGIAALRPAAISINWLGFPGTMGSFKDGTPLFDYMLSDRFITPAAAAQDYAETLALLPDCYQANDRLRPVGTTPSRASCQLPANSFVFCCFNQSFKISEEVFALWMRLLQAKPDSVLWLLECNIWAKQNLLSVAETHGITADRLIFAARVSIADHLARHVHADLFLDTQPYNAHTTASDALWMGVPLLTCAGDTFAARVAGSLLHAIDLNELITYTLQDYENKALYFLDNPQALLAIRQKLQRNKTDSALFDTPLFARSLEAIYQRLWQQRLDAAQN
jgi:predicted O-linked N-acetylglucosamine transferase (SPINDLY family)